MQRSRSPHFATLAGSLAFALGGAVVSAGPPVAASVGIRARAVAPGEPLRIVVETSQPLEQLTCRLQGRYVHMIREDARPGDERWSGWAMIDLDQEPGPAVVEVSGTADDGRPVVGTHAITVAAKEFPTERLRVAPKYVEPPEEVRRRLDRERRDLAVMYRMRSDREPAREAFVRPVPGSPTSAFGTRRVFNGKPRSPHPGLDLRAPTGTAVHASGAGRVVLARDLYYSGWTVILDHGGGLFTLYAHLSEIDVAEGDPVRPSQVLGRSGATGRVTGPHLHWGAKVGDRPFDPTALLDDRLFR